MDIFAIWVDAASYRPSPSTSVQYVPGRPLCRGGRQSLGRRLLDTASIDSWYPRIHQLESRALLAMPRPLGWPDEHLGCSRNDVMHQQCSDERPGYVRIG